MRFYLGTHIPNWLEKLDVPLFVSRRTLYKRKRLPQALGPWALDSGGFSELSMFGEWRTPAAQYVEEVARFQGIGNMEWAAPRDWMCEPWLVEKTGLSVEEHQERTVADYLDLRQRAPHLPFRPVLQGWTLKEYMACAELYASAGVDLSVQETVGLGSVCRRQQLEGGREVIEEFARRGIRLHAFGMKITGLRQIAYLLKSSDSMAWSYAGRMKTPPPSHGHKSCANCMTWALEWRQRVLRRVSSQQVSLFA